MACAGENDALKRLECFDLAVARHGSPKGSAVITNSPAPSEGAHAPVPELPPAVKPAAVASAAQPPKHISARIVRIDPVPDNLVVTLDNGQVWEQAQEATAYLGLHAGESISIDRQLGSYWLSAANGIAIKVRQKR